ncbi:MAG: ATP synthase F0 subunit B [Spirochaetaceae bacterium]|jgi:F-type H+-transporting ATPase subunit b|nr:ATP synthase F0 subunit B [Spirochaetaceae bacterium]
MLDFSVSFFFTLVNIVILFVALRAILFKPVTKFMDERTAKIQGEIDGAAKERDEAKSLRQKYEEKMAAAVAEAAKIRQEAGEQAEKQAEKIIADGKVQAESILANARKQIQSEREAALLAFKAEAAALVVNAAGRLLRRDPSETASGDTAYAELVLREIEATN